MHLDGSAFYDLDGNRITMRQWARLTEERNSRVSVSTLADGTYISTVWVGLDYSFGSERQPLIYETMVFPSENDWHELDCERYSTRVQAVAGHQAMVEKWSK
jgi:hypothetical protein